MNDYVTNTTWAEIADRLRAARRIALITHAKPDGDAFGSLLALARALPALGKAADIYLMGPIEPPLLAVAADTPFHRVEQTFPDDDYDVVVVADTGAWSQLEPLEAWLRAHHDRTIVIDHHAHGDEVGALRMVDPTAGAAAELIVPLLDTLGCELTGGVGGVAEALYAGLGTDTGWFRFAGAKARTFEIAARLLRCGVDKSRLYQLLEETYHPGRLELERRALSSVQFARRGSVAFQALRRVDLQEAACSVEDLTNIVNLPMVVREVRVSVLLTEIESSVTKASFRAKPSLDACWTLDVNRLAQEFGGGGHVHASGARLAMDLDAARHAILQAIIRESPAPA